MAQASGPAGPGGIAHIGLSLAVLAQVEVLGETS